MSVLEQKIDYIDGLTRRIYLKEGVSDFYPIEDIYHEYRNLRRTDESLRKWEPFLLAEGNVSKGGGAFTPRYVMLLEGTKIIPFNESLQVNQLGDMITDNADVDPILYDVQYITVGKTIFIKPSESETIQLNSESIVFSSFLGGVWVDIINGHPERGSSTEPNGNRERPVKTVALAVEIAHVRGFDTIHFLGNVVLDTGDNVEGFTLIGQSVIKTLMVIQPGALTHSCIIRNARVQGTLDGKSIIIDCTIDGLHYFNGEIHDSGFTAATLTLSGGAQASLLDCYSLVAGYETPTVDMGGTGQAMLIREWNGGLKIINKTGIDACSLDFDSGQLKVDETCTAGNIFARGGYKLTDESTGTCYVDTSGKLALEGDINSLDDIAQFVWTYVSRELTVASGMTPEQEEKLDQILIDIQNIECEGGSGSVGNEWEVTIGS